MKNKRLLALLLTLVMLISISPAVGATGSNPIKVNLNFYSYTDGASAYAPYTLGAQITDLKTVSKDDLVAIEIRYSDLLNDTIAPHSMSTAKIILEYDYDKLQPTWMATPLSGANGTHNGQQGFPSQIYNSSTAAAQGYTTTVQDNYVSGTTREVVTLIAAGSAITESNALPNDGVLFTYTFKVVEDAATQVKIKSVEFVSYNGTPAPGGAVTNVNVTEQVEAGNIVIGGPYKLGPAAPLDHIDVTLTDASLAVPTKDNTATTKAKADPNPAEATLGNVTWSIDPAYTGVSIDNEGNITVRPNAAAGNVTVKATEAGGKTGTAELELTKADAGVVSTFALSKTEASIKRGATETLTVKDIEDKYGDPASGTATWAVKTPDAAGKISVNASTGVVTVASDAVVGQSAVISATINGIEKTCTVTVANLDNSNVTAINAANVKVGTDISASLNGAGNGETITWSVVSGPATLKSSATGATATFTTTGEGTVKIQATQPDGTTMKGFTLTKDVTVGGKDPSAKPTVNIAITGGTADGKVVAGEAVTLTANVSGTGVTEANCTYAWTKGGTPAGTGKTLSIAAFDPATDAVKYTCVVTHTQDADHSPTASDAAEITLSEKTKTPVTVTLKTTASNFATGTVNDNMVSDLIDTVTPNEARSLVKGTVAFYEKTKDAVEEVRGVPCDCSKISEPDPDAVEHDADCHYVKAVAAAPAEYSKVTTLAAGKTYYASVGLNAIDNNDDYSYDGQAAPATDPTINDVTGLITVTTKAASTSSGVSGITVRYNVGEHGTLTGSATESVQRGKTPSKVPTVTAKDGYKFLGWSLDGTTVVDPTTVTITSSTTFTALYSSVKNTYISGYPDGTFRPDAHVTRAEVASMLARLNKDFDSNKTYTGSANDVASNTWFANFVNFGMEKGIISGYTDGTFRPDADITRGEFASMMARYMGLSGTGNATFADTNGHWAADSIAVLADKGIVNGYPDGGFHPDAQLTRAEAVQMINTALAVQALTGAAEVTPSDVASTHWAYTQILAAMNTDIKDIIG